MSKRRLFVTINVTLLVLLAIAICWLGYLEIRQQLLESHVDDVIHSRGLYGLGPSGPGSPL